MSNIRVYHESGAVLLVDKMSDETKEENGGTWRYVHLRCLKVLRASPLCPAEVGDEWTSSVRSGSEGYVGWSLSYPRDEDMESVTS